MANSYDLLLKIGGSLSGSYLNAMTKAQKSLSSLGKATKPVTAGFDSVKSKLVGLAATAGIGFGVTEVAKGIYSMAESASNLVEAQNVVDQTYKKSAASVEAWTNTTAASAGINKTAATQMVGTMGAMIKSSGLTETASASMSEKLVQLNGDISSFYNVGTSDMWEKIRAGIAGETKPLKDLGINMSEANLQAYAHSEGINTLYKKMSQAEQTTLRYNYLLSVTKDAQGDFARTASKSMANQARIFQMNMEDAKQTIGAAFLPMMNRMFNAVNPLIQKTLPNLSAGAQKVASFLSAHTGDVTKVANGIIGLGKGATGVLLPAVRTVLSVAMPVVRNLIPGAETAFSKLGNAIKAHSGDIQRVAQIIAKDMSVALRIAGAGVKDIVGFVQQHGPQVISIARGIFGSAQKMFDFLTTHGKLVKDVLIGIVGAMAAYKVIVTAARIAQEISNARMIAGTIATKGAAAAELALKGAKGGTTLATILCNAATAKATLMQGIHTAATKAGAVAAKVAAAAQWVWNAAMNAGLWPVLAVVGGIALLSAGAYLLITHWKQVSAFFAKMLPKIASGFWFVVNKVVAFAKQWGPLILTAILPMLGIPLLIIQHFGQIKAFFAGLWPEIVSGFKGFINMMIDGLNMLIGGLDKFSIKMPSWFPGIGGKALGFSIPQIPRLAQGGIVAHRPGGILANIGEGKYDEAVVPLRGGALGGGSVTFVYAPHNEFKGGEAPAGVQKVLDDDKARFEKQMRQWISDHKRRSPGGKVEFA